MESRRLVVWISTAILGFQGVTLAFDLLNCTALSWLYVRLNGFGPAPLASSWSRQPEPPRGPATIRPLPPSHCSVLVPRSGSMTL